MIPYFWRKKHINLWLIFLIWSWFVTSDNIQAGKVRAWKKVEQTGEAHAARVQAGSGEVQTAEVQDGRVYTGRARAEEVQAGEVQVEKVQSDEVQSGRVQEAGKLLIQKS